MSNDTKPKPETGKEIAAWFRQEHGEYFWAQDEADLADRIDAALRGAALRAWAAARNAELNEANGTVSWVHLGHLPLKDDQ